MAITNHTVKGWVLITVLDVVLCVFAAFAYVTGRPLTPDEVFLGACEAEIHHYRPEGGPQQKVMVTAWAPAARPEQKAFFTWMTLAEAQAECAKAHIHPVKANDTPHVVYDADAPRWAYGLMAVLLAACSVAQAFQYPRRGRGDGTEHPAHSAA